MKPVLISASIGLIWGAALMLLSGGDAFAFIIVSVIGGIGAIFGVVWQNDQEGEPGGASVNSPGKDGDS